MRAELFLYGIQNFWVTVSIPTTFDIHSRIWYSRVSHSVFSFYEYSEHRCHYLIQPRTHARTHTNNRISIVVTRVSIRLIVIRPRDGYRHTNCVIAARSLTMQQFRSEISLGYVNECACVCVCCVIYMCVRCISLPSIASTLQNIHFGNASELHLVYNTVTNVC